MDQTLRIAEDAEDVEYVPPRRRPPGGRGTTVLLLVLVLGFLAWSSLSFLEWDVDRYTAALVALTQYAVPVGGILTVLTLVLRRWLTAIVVTIVTGALLLSVGPRALTDNPAPVDGDPLRVLSANLYFGGADPQRIMDLVRDQDVAVLSLQELTPEMVRKLDRAGLRELLPHRVFHAGPGGEGTGIAARYPLHELSLVPPSSLSQPSARVALPGRDIEFVAAHPIIPVGSDTTGDWRREITSMPNPAADGELPRVLAGDFNATLDHTPLQALLGRGYEDAAEITGDGFYPTWPTGGRPAPPVTIDHVLVSGGVAVRDYRVFEVPGADHRAILAHLVVPRG